MDTIRITALVGWRRARRRSSLVLLFVLGLFSALVFTGRAFAFGGGTVAMDMINSGGNGIQETWRDSWSAGWTDVDSFVLSGRSYLVGYKSGGGSMAIDQIKAGAEGSGELWRNAWSKGSSIRCISVP